MTIHFNIFYVIFVSYAITVLNAQDVCTKKGPCLCEFANGTGIDLSPSIKSDFYTAPIYELKENGAQYELSTYYFHPCVDIAYIANSTFENNTCNINLSMCRHVKKMNLNVTDGSFRLTNGSYEYLGQTNLSSFSPDGQSIIYQHGPSSTTVMLICAETDDNLQVSSLADPNKLKLSFYSRSACLKQIEEVGRSLGSTLLIVFFSFLIFYIVLGVGTKKFLMGATGLEVIPNLGFWTDLPNLVRDGWAFAINGFKLPPRTSGPVTSPDPNSYDSI